jgi:hypothetical protein
MFLQENDPTPVLLREDAAKLMGWSIRKLRSQRERRIVPFHEKVIKGKKCFVYLEHELLALKRRLAAKKGSVINLHPGSQPTTADYEQHIGRLYMKCEMLQKEKIQIRRQFSPARRLG